MNDDFEEFLELCNDEPQKKFIDWRGILKNNVYLKKDASKRWTLNKETGPWPENWFEALFAPYIS